MKVYAWFYPDMARLADEDYLVHVFSRLQRLRATGLYCMAPEGPALAAPEALLGFFARCVDMGIDCQLGFLPFSEPPNPTPEMLRRRYAYLQDGTLKHRDLCPAWQENRLLALHRAAELLGTFNPPALHLDFMRYYFANNAAFGQNLEWEEGRKWLDTYHRCQCPLCQTERLELLGREPTDYDRNHPGYIYKRLQQRVTHVDEVLRGLRHLCDEREMRLTVAVRVQYFNRALIEGQDWVRWAQQKLVHALSPMNYATDLGTTERRFVENKRLLQHTQIEIIEGLARKSSAGETAPETLRAQINRVAELGAAGVAIFHLDTLTEEDFGA